MEEIQEVSLEPLPSSRYLAPMRMVYSQAGRPSRAWDLMRYHYNIISLSLSFATVITVIMILDMTGVTAAWPW